MLEKLQSIEYTPRIKALVWYSGLCLISFLFGVIAWKYTGGRDGFLNILLILISIVFFLLAGVAVAGVVYVYKTSEEDFAKHAKRSAKKKGKSSATSEPAPPVEVEFPGETKKKPRPAKKKPRPADKPPGASAKKPRPAKKPAKK